MVVEQASEFGVREGGGRVIAGSHLTELLFGEGAERPKVAMLTLEADAVRLSRVIAVSRIRGGMARRASGRGLRRKTVVRIVRIEDAHHAEERLPAIGLLDEAHRALHRPSRHMQVRRHGLQPPALLLQRCEKRRIALLEPSRISIERRIQVQGVFQTPFVHV